MTECENPAGIQAATLSLAEYQSEVTRLCFSADPTAGLSRLAADAKMRSGIDPAVTEARWTGYRKMVRTRLSKVIELAFPLTLEFARPEQHEGEHPLVSTYLNERGATERLFRRVPLDFADFTQATFDVTQQQALLDVLRYEKAKWALRAAPDDVVATTDLDFEKPIALTKAMTLLRTDFAVQKPASTLEACEEKETLLLIYRDAEFQVRTLTLTPLAFAHVSSWLAPHESLTQASREVAEERGLVISQAFIEGLAGLLSGYIERGIVLGSQAQSDHSHL